MTGESLGGAVDFLLKWGPYLCGFAFFLYIIEAVVGYRERDKMLFYTSIWMAVCFGGILLIYFLYER